MDPVCFQGRWSDSYHLEFQLYLGMHSTPSALRCRHTACGHLQDINDISRESSSGPLGLCDLCDSFAPLVPLLTSYCCLLLAVPTPLGCGLLDERLFQPSVSPSQFGKPESPELVVAPSFLLAQVSFPALPFLYLKDLSNHHPLFPGPLSSRNPIVRQVVEVTG